MGPSALAFQDSVLALEALRLALVPASVLVLVEPVAQQMAVRSALMVAVALMGSPVPRC